MKSGVLVGPHAHQPTMIYVKEDYFYDFTGRCTLKTGTSLGGRLGVSWKEVIPKEYC
jgi:hypothetical protein